MAKNAISAAQMNDLHSALRHVSDDIADLVMSLAEDIVAGVAADARQRVPVRTGRARGSYQAHGTAIVIGDGVPYVPWLEFGGKVGRKKTTKRPYVPGGRYLYPAIADNLADVERKIDDLISQATNGFLTVDGG